MPRTSRRRHGLNIWPGFVDALASLLMVVIFVLMIFTLGHFFLSDALSGRDQALDRLNVQITQLGKLLSLEQAASGEQKKQLSVLSANLNDLTTQKRRLDRQLSTTVNALEIAGETIKEQSGQISTQETNLDQLDQNIKSLDALRAQLESEVAQLTTDLDQNKHNLVIKTELSNRSLAQLELANRQMLQLREQLKQISMALELEQEKSVEQKEIIAQLGEKLNLALVNKVQKLAQYRSEFFGRLREALGDNPLIRIEGDRFVFQSELLFASASAELEEAGRIQLSQLVVSLRQITPKIPNDIDWILRIDGHTDKRAIKTAQFPSNWELSSARAIAIVQFISQSGIPAKRLVAAGFGEHHPLDLSENELAYARNRRIEIKLTSR